MYNTHQKFDTGIKPHKPIWLLKVIEWGASFTYFKLKGLKVNKIGTKGLKPPYIVLQNHASIVDFAAEIVAVAPEMSYWLSSIEEFVGKEFFFRMGGVTYKRKFTADPTSARHLLHIIKIKKGVLTIYPEARFSFVGINEPLDPALGDLLKHCGCPVVIHLQRGNFLRSPQWAKVPDRNIRVESDFKLLLSAENIKNMTPAEIQAKVESEFVYDEYAWQRDSHIKLKYKNRMRGIHRVLYKCPICGTEYETDSDGAEIWCKHCGARWHQDEYGVLSGVGNETVYSHIPDWYRWQKQEVANEVESGKYSYSEPARLEILMGSAVGIVPFAVGTLTHGYDGLKFEGTDNEGKPFVIERKAQSMNSCHIDYNLMKKGGCVEICNNTDTYFCFPESGDKRITKLHFAVMAMYNHHNNK